MVHLDDLVAVLCRNGPQLLTVPSNAAAILPLADQLRCSCLSWDKRVWYRSLWPHQTLTKGSARAKRSKQRRLRPPIIALREAL